MDSIRDVFAFRIREQRGERTQEAFSASLGIPLSTWQKFEKGVVPQKKKLQELVKKLGLQSETQLFLDPDFIPKDAETAEAALEFLRRVIALGSESSHILRAAEPTMNEDERRAAVREKARRLISEGQKKRKSQ